MKRLLLFLGLVALLFPVLGTSKRIPRFYASTSFWNQSIPSNPAIDPNSATMVATSLVPFAGSSNFANTDAWGIAMVHSRNSDPLYNIGCTHFDCSTPVSFHIPVGAQPTTGSDAHLVVINDDTGEELDMWRASFNGSTWIAGSRYITDSKGWGAICGLGEHCNGAVAAGFAAFGGIAMPEQFSSVVINHALTLTPPLIRANYIACPATHTDGEDSASAIPEGARVQLNPAFDVDSQPWPSYVKTIARTLQLYGAYVSDDGGTLAIRGEADLNREGAWAARSIPEGFSLSMLPWSQMRVLQLQQC